MSVHGQFLAVPAVAMRTRLKTSQDICDFIEGRLDIQPPEILDIQDAWHVMAKLFKKLGLGHATGGKQLQIDCALGCTLIPMMDVAAIPFQLRNKTPEDIREALDSLDYGDAYQGEIYAEDKAGTLQIFGRICGFYDRCAQSSCEVLFVLG